MQTVGCISCTFLTLDQVRVVAQPTDRLLSHYAAQRTGQNNGEPIRMLMVVRCTVMSKRCCCQQAWNRLHRNSPFYVDATLSEKSMIDLLFDGEPECCRYYRIIMWTDETAISNRKAMNSWIKQGMVLEELVFFCIFYWKVLVRYVTGAFSSYHLHIGYRSVHIWLHAFLTICINQTLG